MPVFQLKARTAETYLAGIGASGALMASAFVMFVILVGVVTFDAWPRVGNLFGNGDGAVSLNSRTLTPAVTAPTKTPNLVKLLGHKAPAVTTQSVAPASGVSQAPVRSEGRLEGGTNGGAPGGSTGGQVPTGNPEPPPPSPVEQGSTVVRGAVSTVGNSVEGTTNVVGDTLGGNSNMGVGGLVGGLGRTVNSTVQGLVGNNN
jgi:hypothetical protein